ncbi:heme peroxidase family protein [Crocosphaera watsonii]|nr:peroxidase [Crocosphaera sp.]
MKHGNESFLIESEGLVEGPLLPSDFLPEKNGVRGIFSRDVKPKSDEKVLKPTRRFCRLFSQGDQPSGQSLIDLGNLMETEDGDTNDDRDSNIPAGYTYLGQFIDHDITLDRDTELTLEGTIDPDRIENFRTPSLDLDSLYLDGPENNPELYNSDKRTFKIGKTSDVQDLGIFDNDLPRKGDNAGQGENPTDAVIGDGRNDENLAVAQTHLAFLKFHNARAKANPEKSFEDLRREVILHYQAIVLTDFLPRVLDQDVLQDVLDNGRKFYTNEEKDCMPIEFSVAAYRMGHSMIRPTYEWNRIFNTDGLFRIANFTQIFEFSGGSGSRGEGDSPFEGFPTLPSNWIVDWRRLFDFSEVGGEKHEQLNFARKLDAKMALDLKKLPEFEQMAQTVPAPLLSLATRNLLRGRLVSLPSGQEVAAAVGETALTPTEILSNVPEDQAEILRKHDFDKVTPLWYYILRESMVQANGNHLGKVGSRIVAETFVGLIENSSINVISEQPDLRFSMPEMLMESPENINPLELRILRLASPFMRGRDVRRVQIELRERGYLTNDDPAFLTN